MPNGTYAIETNDWCGRHVVMTQKTYDEHKFRHPEVPTYVEEAKILLSDPDGVLEVDNGAIYIFRFGLGRGVYGKLYLGMYLYYSGNQGRIATYFFTDEIVDGRVLEYRAQWLAGERFSLLGGKKEDDK